MLARVIQIEYALDKLDPGVRFLSGNGTTHKSDSPKCSIPSGLMESGHFGMERPGKHDNPTERTLLPLARGTLGHGGS